MVTVEFMGPIGREPISIEAKSLAELALALQADESIAQWLPSCAIAVNDMMISDKDHPLKSGDRVVLLPPVCGG